MECSVRVLVSVGSWQLRVNSTPSTSPAPGGGPPDAVGRFVGRFQAPGRRVLNLHSARRGHELHNERYGLGRAMSPRQSQVERMRRKWDWLRGMDARCLSRFRRFSGVRAGGLLTGRSDPAGVAALASHRADRARVHRGVGIGLLLVGDCLVPPTYIPYEQEGAIQGSPAMLRDCPRGVNGREYRAAEHGQRTQAQRSRTAPCQSPDKALAPNEIRAVWCQNEVLRFPLCATGSASALAEPVAHNRNISK